jgi:hypothetical protein
MNLRNMSAHLLLTYFDFHTAICCDKILSSVCVDDNLAFAQSNLTFMNFKMLIQNIIQLQSLQDLLLEL